jgi:hypothetical protein
MQFNFAGFFRIRFPILLLYKYNMNSVSMYNKVSDPDPFGQDYLGSEDDRNETGSGSV